MRRDRRDYTNSLNQMNAFENFSGESFENFSDDDLDAMIDRAIPGSRRPANPVRPISPWVRLLNQSIQALQNAIAHLGPPINRRSATSALYRAEGQLNRAGQEVRRVMSGSRQAAVLDQLGNAAIRISVARAAIAGGSAFIPGGRSLIPPQDSLRAAINHIRAAQNAVGLRSV